jgi:trehalose synthase
LVTLHEYKDIVGAKVLYEIYQKARELYGKHVVHVNSTYFGGGVAVLLKRMVPLMNDVGLTAEWRVLQGSADFFTITKKFHNALQGEDINFTEIKQQVYLDTNEDFSLYAQLDDDCVIIHDLQPLPLIRFYKKLVPWIWRCHVDLSNPDREVWNFLSDFILKYDLVIFSNDDYTKEDLPNAQRIIPPAIDPLTIKNVPLSDQDIMKYMDKYGIKTDKPIIAQVSRFDKWKDPMGVLKIFQEVRKQVDCRLILLGNMATDDPYGISIYNDVFEKVSHSNYEDDIVLLNVESDILVNAVQTRADVIIQKSLREGFGLTVTEAMWKGTPVVASKVGGIPLQIKDGKTGYLVDPTDKDGFVERIVKILKDPDHAKALGEKARESVREKFLITRLLSDYLDTLIDVFK